MSQVSGVVLTVSVCEERTEGRIPVQVVALNAWLADRGRGVLVEVSSHGGGHKHPQILIYAGGFNYLDEDEFIAAVRAQPWQCPGNVALIVNPEEGPVRAIALGGEVA